MFYCTLYQKTSGTDRVRVALSFSSKQEAINAAAEIIRVAKSLGAKVSTYDYNNRHSVGPYNYEHTYSASISESTRIEGHIVYTGFDSHEIFSTDTSRTEKVYYTVIESEKSLGNQRRLYHPMKDLIVDGVEFLRTHKSADSKTVPDWYDELSELNK